MPAFMELFIMKFKGQSWVYYPLQSSIYFWLTLLYVWIQLRWPDGRKTDLSRSLISFLNPALAAEAGHFLQRWQNIKIISYCLQVIGYLDICFIVLTSDLTEDRPHTLGSIVGATDFGFIFLHSNSFHWVIIFFPSLFESSNFCSKFCGWKEDPDASYVINGGKQYQPSGLHG